MNKNELIEDHLCVEDFEDYISTKEAIKRLFGGFYRVAYAQHGGYQGEAGSVWEIDGEYIAVSDYFGSCSGCDKFLATHSQEERERLLKTMVRNGHMEDTRREMIDYLREAADDPSSYDFQNLGDELAQELQEE